MSPRRLHLIVKYFHIVAFMNFYYLKRWVEMFSDQSWLQDLPDFFIIVLIGEKNPEIQGIEIRIRKPQKNPECKISKIQKSRGSGLGFENPNKSQNPRDRDLFFRDIIPGIRDFITTGYTRHSEFFNLGVSPGPGVFFVVSRQKINSVLRHADTETEKK